MIFLTQETERQTLPFGKWFLNRKKNKNDEKKKKKKVVPSKLNFHTNMG